MNGELLMLCLGALLLACLRGQPATRHYQPLRPRPSREVVSPLERPENFGGPVGRKPVD